MSAKSPSRAKGEPKTTLSEEQNLPLDVTIANRLIKDIIDGVYEPGRWIREQEVASRFGVSHTPVRSAFRHVSRAGFIEMRPWRGAKILEMSAEDTRYVMDLLEAVYGVAMRIAAETVPAQHFPLLDTMLQKTVGAVRTPATRRQIDLAFQLGRRLSRWSASPLAHDMLNRVGSLALWQHRFFDFDVPAAAQRSIQLHTDLVNAVKTRQADAAERAAREIIALSRSFLVPRVRVLHDETSETKARRKVRAPRV